MSLSRPTKEQMRERAAQPGGMFRLQKLQEVLQGQRDELARRLDRYYGVPCPSDMAAERAQVIAECEALRDVLDSSLADCAEILGGVRP